LGLSLAIFRNEGSCVNEAAAKEAHERLLAQMLDERQMLNRRLMQISSNTHNIAFWLSPTGRAVELFVTGGPRKQ